MTNGEKIKEMFPNIEIVAIVPDEIVVTKKLDGTGEYSRISFRYEWWNAEYKEPTTKNDLGVDCISREEVLDLCDSKDPNYEIRHLKEDVECLPSVYPKSEGLDDKTLDSLWDEAITLYDKEGQPHSCVLTNTLNNYNRKWHKDDKPKTGHWIRVAGGSFIDDYRCDCCNHQPSIRKVGYTWGWDFTDFCPNCGVKMESEG